jgi:hypothetical protein
MPNRLASLPSVETAQIAFVPQETTATDTMAFLPSQSHRVSYDMGLGKNPSLAERKSLLMAEAGNAHSLAQQELQNVDPSLVQEAAQHWFDYEAVRDFPSPFPAVHDTTHATGNTHHELQQPSSAQVNSESPVAVTKKSAKSFPPLKPHRSASDVLQIRSNKRQLKQQTQQKDSLDSSEQASLPFISRVAGAHQKHQQNHDEIQLDPNTIWVEMLLHQLEQQEATAMAIA